MGERPNFGPGCYSFAPADALVRLFREMKTYTAKPGEIERHWYVVDADGHVLEPYEKARFANLPLVVGERAAEAAPPLFAALDREPALRAKLRAAVLVADRRWTLKLHDGTDVKLPVTDLGEAVSRLGLRPGQELLALVSAVSAGQG